ncbi:Trk-type K+ transport system membrane component [Labrenzia sp. EL_126]|nr:Trk-type K+ transport system membrane component [Labrenzia sp. EL_126]
MNYRAIALPIGRLLILISLMMFIPAIVDLVASDVDWQVFLASSLALGTTGLLVNLAFHGQKFPHRFRESIVFVNAAWVVFPWPAPFLSISAIWTSGLQMRCSRRLLALQRPGRPY